MAEPSQITFADARYDLQLAYPLAVGGHPVEREDEHLPGVLTMRLVSNNRQDVYFEVSRFAGANAQQLYDTLRGRSRAAGELEVGDAASIVVDTLPSLSFALRRGQLRRAMVLTQWVHDVYRITYNPLHPANHGIFATLRFMVCSEHLKKSPRPPCNV